VQTEQQRLLSDQADLAKQNLALARLLGLHLGTELKLEEKLYPNPALLPPIDDIIAHGIARRTDLKSDEASLRAAEQALQAARAERLPNASLPQTPASEAGASELALSDSSPLQSAKCSSALTKQYTPNRIRWKPKMELKNLKSFVAVAEQLSFVRSAKLLHLSQSALTEQIQRLEEELGVQLFLRNRRTVKLTGAGIVFLPEARATLTRARQAVERVKKAARGETGRLRIGFVSSAALEIVPNIVVAFRNRFPEVALDLTNLRTSSQIKALLNESIDVGFVRLPLSHEQLMTTVIHRESFVMVLPLSHSLAGEERVHLAQLQNEKFVVYGRRWAPGFHDAIVQMCTREGFSPEMVQETGEMYTAIALVAAGMGVAILPQSVVLAQAHNVVTKPLPSSAGISEIAVALRKGESASLVHSFVRVAETYRDGR
jgi:DNA-binding transcriptional LysR family regulator